MNIVIKHIFIYHIIRIKNLGILNWTGRILTVFHTYTVHRLIVVKLSLQVQHKCFKNRVCIYYVYARKENNYNRRIFVCVQCYSNI